MSLRDEVCRANRMLTELGLVVMHSGNVSGIDRDADVVFIKPSGVDYDALTPEAIVPIRFSTGEPLEQAWKPSVDLVHHLELYRRMPEVGAIVHTHSNYATAFAACERPIPPVLTAIADEFGGAIPCTPYVANEGTQIAEAILGARGVGPAVLLGRHGVFAWGPTPRAAIKAAAMVEDVAKTVWLALQIGSPTPLTEPEIAGWWDRYHSRYGQGEC